jgi:predicted metal-dependent hydrolase
VRIKIPHWLGSKEASKAAEELYARIKKSIESRPEHYIEKSLELRDGQVISILDSSFCMHISESERRGGSGRLNGSDIYISLPALMAKDRKDKMISSITRRLVYGRIKDSLRGYVEEVNRRHFNSRIRDVRVHGGTSRWGSYRPDGVISLSFNLFFMPRECLEYVVVHELAHTRVRGHTQRFWGIVESIIADYKKRRRFLNEYNYSNPGGEAACDAIA